MYSRFFITICIIYLIISSDAFKLQSKKYNNFHIKLFMSQNNLKISNNFISNKVIASFLTSTGLLFSPMISIPMFTLIQPLKVEANNNNNNNNDFIASKLFQKAEISIDNTYKTYKLLLNEWNLINNKIINKINDINYSINIINKI